MSSPMNGATEHSLEDEVDAALLHRYPLPDPNAAADKDERGRILLIGGCTQMPGAIILAALGAMRAGAGKICVMTAERVTPVVAQALPEARVIGVAESASGGLTLASIEQIAGQWDAICIGPGMQDESATSLLARRVMQHCPEAAFVLDAFAMSAIKDATPPPSRNIVITPHPGEMAHLSGRSKEAVQNDLRGAALFAARQWQVVTAMKSSTTFVASPDGQVFRHTGGNVGLAISGSGDVLAGIIAGLSARGAPLLQATFWGVFLHARSGDRLAEREGPIGYLARDLPTLIPQIMAEFSASN